ncbi:glycosyltransferase [Actinokineospora sp. 24-640]
MRVTIVSRLFRPETGADAYRLGALADELAVRGHQVRVLTTVPPKGTRIDDGGLDVRRWPVLRDKGGNVRGYVQYLSYDIPLFFRLLLTRGDVVVVEPPTTTGVVSRVACAARRTSTSPPTSCRPRRPGSASTAWS